MLHYVTLRCMTLQYVALVTLSYISLHYVALRYLTLHYVAIILQRSHENIFFFAEYFFTSSLSKDAVNNPDCKASGEAMRIENFVDAEHGLIKVTVLEFSRNSSRIVCAVPTFET